MDTYALPSVSYYANLADGTCGTDVEGAFMAGKRHGVDEPQGDAADTYLHPEHKRAVLPAANETGGVREAESPEVYEIDAHDIPRLVWFQKGEDAVEVPTFTIHQHEAVNPLRILKATFADQDRAPVQLDLFGLPEADRRRLRTEEIYAYNHTMQWTNRLIAGDSLLVMNALLRHERLAGQVQCIYMDPPYGIKFGSNFMPSIHKRDVKDGKDEDLTAEPEMVTAFRDTWKWGVHSYLSYLRDRLILMRDLLAPTGSIFVQISMENVHRVRCLLDEVFGPDNCVSMISYTTTSGNESGTLDRAGDYLLWYAKDREKVKYHELFKEKTFGGEGASKYRNIELESGERMPISEWERRTGSKFVYEDRPTGSRVYRLDNLTSRRSAGNGDVREFEFGGRKYSPGNGTFKTTLEGLQRLAAANRLEASANTLNYVRYLDDFNWMSISNLWDDVGGIQSRADSKVYVVQTSREVIQRCILMTTDPGDLVLDPTCGSGTTAVVAEEWGRRWITIDTSRVALALAKRRLITQAYDWYKLADEGRGVDGGLVYKTVPHVMLGDIANGVPSREETLWDRPIVEKGRVRVTGPFTVEALPEPVIEPLLEARPEEGMAAGRNLEEWVAELRASGIRTGSGEERLRFRSLEVSGAHTWFHARGVTEEGQEALVCLGSASAPMSLAVVHNALDEADDVRPRPALLVFAAFQFTAEASEALARSKVGYARVLTVQMNTDLQMTDLLKRQFRNQSFTLVGQPDVALVRDTEGMLTAEVLGFDYYDPVRQTMTSRGAANIAMWMVDGNYDGRCVNPEQCLFPGADVWRRLEATLRGTIAPERLRAYQGTKSLPFKPGENRKVAVKIIDDKGFESLRVFALTEDGAPREAAR